MSYFMKLVGLSIGSFLSFVERNFPEKIKLKTEKEIFLFSLYSFYYQDLFLYN